jgi:Flagellar basal body rod FlgEFG protein C-terminal
MPVSATALSSAVNALKLYSRRVDQAAEQIASVGLGDLTPDPVQPVGGAAPAPESGTQDLAGAMVDMMIAQRAFAAQLRVIRTADDMLKDSIEQTRPQ